MVAIQFPAIQVGIGGQYAGPDGIEPSLVENLVIASDAGDTYALGPDSVPAVTKDDPVETWIEFEGLKNGAPSWQAKLIFTKAGELWSVDLDGIVHSIAGSAYEVFNGDAFTTPGGGGTITGMLNATGQLQELVRDFFYGSGGEFWIQVGTASIRRSRVNGIFPIWSVPVREFTTGERKTFEIQWIYQAFNRWEIYDDGNPAEDSQFFDFWNGGSYPSPATFSSEATNSGGFVSGTFDPNGIVEDHVLTVGAYDRQTKWEPKSDFAGGGGDFDTGADYQLSGEWTFEQEVIAQAGIRIGPDGLYPGFSSIDGYVGSHGYPLALESASEGGLVFATDASSPINRPMLRARGKDLDLCFGESLVNVPDYGPVFNAGGFHFAGPTAKLSAVAPISYATNQRVVDIKKDDGALDLFWINERDGAGLSMGGSRGLGLYRDSVGVGLLFLTAADELALYGFDNKAVNLTGRSKNLTSMAMVNLCAYQPPTDPELTPVVVIGTGQTGQFAYSNRDVSVHHHLRTEFYYGIRAANLPTSSAGLADGDFWDNAGVVNVVSPGGSAQGAEHTVAIEAGETEVVLPMPAGGRTCATIDMRAATGPATIQLDFGPQGGRHGSFILKLGLDAKDLTWLSNGTLRFMGGEPAWTAHNGATFVVLWRWDGERCYLIPSPPD